MKITYRIHPLVEQLTEISELPEHLQERIYKFMNNYRFTGIGKENNRISMSDMLDRPGTVNATIDTHGNINCGFYKETAITEITALVAQIARNTEK